MDILWRVFYFYQNRFRIRLYSYIDGVMKTGPTFQFQIIYLITFVQFCENLLKIGLTDPEIIGLTRGLLKINSNRSKTYSSPGRHAGKLKVSVCDLTLKSTLLITANHQLQIRSFHRTSLSVSIFRIRPN